jgi:hypothetical protein
MLSKSVLGKNICDDIFLFFFVEMSKKKLVDIIKQLLCRKKSQKIAKFMNVKIVTISLTIKQIIINTV